MTNRVPYARIAITLPETDLAAADRLAKQHDRSRSWIIAEAVRRYAASQDSRGAGEDLGDSRRAQLRRDLALTPEERVWAAEETAQLSAPATAPRIFATFNDFLRAQRAGPASS